MRTTEISVDTSVRRVVDLTDDAATFCKGAGDGLLHVLAPHVEG